MSTEPEKPGAKPAEKSKKKKFLYVNRRAPYGTIYALEALEVVLIGAAFEQDVSLAFLDDGVFQLAKGQDTKGIGMKNFSNTYRALGDFGVTRFYVEKESLQARGLTLDDLQSITYEDEKDGFKEKPSILPINRAELTKLMSEQDVVLTF
jgi:tRNA 2-thiouridine synthesizing protein C